MMSITHQKPFCFCQEAHLGSPQKDWGARGSASTPRSVLGGNSPSLLLLLLFYYHGVFCLSGGLVQFVSM